MVRNRKRGFWFLTGACVTLSGLAAGLTLAFVGGTTSTAPVARARSYTNFQACLLTSERGLADPAAAPLWAGMQEASLATHAKVSYLAVRGPQTSDNALPFLGSLLIRHCQVVLAAGQPERDAITQRASKYKTVKFAVVGGTSAGSNIVVLSGNAAAIRNAAAREVSDATVG
jgi:basic membrane lipoprotein Med (substrate-binding protein (PBP1-ABC) superfamily)